MITYLLKKKVVRGYSDREVWELQDRKCFYCYKPVCIDSNTYDFRDCTRDHLFPKCLGFHIRGNMVIACEACNLRKANRLPTLAEVTKAWVMIYSQPPRHGSTMGPLRDFICHVKNGKIRVRLTDTKHYSIMKLHTEELV